MSTASSILHVARLALSPQAPALHLALRSWPEEDRAAMLETVSELRSDAPSPLVLIEGRRGSVLAGAALAQCVPGKAAVVWPPQLVEPQPLVTASTLLDELCRELAAHEVVLAQALVSAEALLDAEHLQAGGFSLLADLLYLQASVSATQAMPVLPFEAQPLQLGDQKRLAAVIDRSYIGSHDCPQLDGVRSTADVLEGYRAIGVYRPELWLLLRHDGQDVGCLLLADHPQQRQLELIYMGFVPEARGRGWGEALVRHAQALARSAQRERLVLAVDAANRPALRLYEAADFQAWDRRSIYWKLLREHS